MSKPWRKPYGTSENLDKRLFLRKIDSQASAIKGETIGRKSVDDGARLCVMTPVSTECTCMFTSTTGTEGAAARYSIPTEAVALAVLVTTRF